MATTATLSATDAKSGVLSIRPGESLDISLAIDGTEFVGQIDLERSRTTGQTWERYQSFTAAASANIPEADGWWRFRAASVGTKANAAGSGVITDIADVTNAATDDAVVGATTFSVAGTIGLSKDGEDSITAAVTATDTVTDAITALNAALVSAELDIEATVPPADGDGIFALTATGATADLVGWTLFFIDTDADPDATYEGPTTAVLASDGMTVSLDEGNDIIQVIGPVTVREETIEVPDFARVNAAALYLSSTVRLTLVEGTAVLQTLSEGTWTTTGVFAAP